MRKQFSAIALSVAAVLAACPATAAVEYYHLDALGSVRAVTDQAGGVLERHDFLPYGEECTTGPCAANPAVGAGQAKKFTGKERDPESGLDYFDARFYHAQAGRFTTRDPVLSASSEEPQRWNRYAYCQNNPLTRVDPDGRQDGLATMWALNRTPGSSEAYAEAWGLWVKTAINFFTGPLRERGHGLAPEPPLFPARNETEQRMMDVGEFGLTLLLTRPSSVRRTERAAELFAEANAARDALKADLALSQHPPATVVGAYSPSTGRVTAGASLGGGLGCAEGVCSQALGHPADIQFTTAVRPRTGQGVDVCLSCETTYGRGAFPDPATRFRSDRKE